MKIYWYEVIGDYVFEEPFEVEFYDFEHERLKKVVWECTRLGNWHGLEKTKSMEFVCRVK